MKSCVIYATTSGNTRSIAEAIAGALRQQGTVEVIKAGEASPTLPEAEIIFIGGPTERHTMTEPMRRFLEGLAPGSLRGRTVAAFDTRLRWPRALSGSAAVDIAKRVSAAGARMAAPAESFMVSAKPELEPGEIERAVAWAAAVADPVAARVPVG